MPGVLRVSSRNARFQQWQALLGNRNKRQRAGEFLVQGVRPISLVPFPSEAVARAADGARAVAVYENNQGQMIDDVRLAVLGRTPVTFIGGLSLDSSGFGIAPDLDVAHLKAKIQQVMEGVAA